MGGLIQLSVVCIYPRRTASESGTKGATKGDLEKGDAESTEGSTKSPTEPEAEERVDKEAQGTETC